MHEISSMEWEVRDGRWHEMRISSMAEGWQVELWGKCVGEAPLLALSGNREQEARKSRKGEGKESW